MRLKQFFDIHFFRFFFSRTLRFYSFLNRVNAYFAKKCYLLNEHNRKWNNCASEEVYVGTIHIFRFYKGTVCQHKRTTVAKAMIKVKGLHLIKRYAVLHVVSGSPPRISALLKNLGCKEMRKLATL